MTRPVFHCHFDAQPAELALDRDLQILEGLFIKIGGVRVQSGHHATDGIIDKLLVLDRLNVVLLDCIEHVSQSAYLFNRQLPGRYITVGTCRVMQTDQDPQKNPAQHQPNLLQSAHYFSRNSLFGGNPARRIQRLTTMPYFKV